MLHVYVKKQIMETSNLRIIYEAIYDDGFSERTISLINEQINEYA